MLRSRTIHVVCVMAVASIGCFAEAPALDSEDTDAGDGSDASPSEGGAAGGDDDGDDGGEGADAGEGGTASDDAQDSGPSGDSDDPQDECVGEDRCVPLAPESWTGPIRWQRADDEDGAACTSHELAVDSAVHAEVAAGSLDCGCACDPAYDACVHQLDFYGTQTLCSGFPVVEMNDGFMCYLTPGGYFRMTADATANPSCAPEASPSRSPSGWGRHALACAPTSTSDCTDGLCMPASDEPACIFREGEHACPTQWPVRELWYRGQTDARACDCSCGTPSGTDCAGEVLVFEGLDCQGEPTAALELDHCEGDSLPLGDHNFIYVPNEFGTCTPHTAIVGDVVPTDPVTLCCAS